MKSTWLVCLFCLWAGAAGAQTAATDAAAECPVMPTDISQSLRWDAMRVPKMLVCRAVVSDTGAEAFAMTISEASSFKPRRADRAETGTLDGREIQWYRSEVANEPNTLIRETQVELDNDRVLHIFMRAQDPETLAQHQKMAQSLRLSAATP